MTRSLICGQFQVFDDTVPEPLYRELLQTMRRIGWQFGWYTASNPNARYWHHEIGYGAKDNAEDISSAASKHPMPVFASYQEWLKDALLPQGCAILRFYLNAHTYGTDGWPHTDTERPGEVTTILYLTDTWKNEWCGETVVFNAEGDIERSALPRFNRMIAFPSDWVHGPRPLSKSFGGLRVVLVVKVGLGAASSMPMP